MAGKVSRSMRALKLLVVGMGVLLVLGTGALVWAVVYRVNHPRPSPVTASKAGTTVIDLPPGGRVESSEVAGDRLVLRLALPDGSGRLLIFDLHNGAPIGTIELRPGGASGEAKR
jgi:hypothetical protein